MPKEVQTILDANNILTEKSKVVNIHYMRNCREYTFSTNREDSDIMNSNESNENGGLNNA